jgi:hypothetical protein
MVAPKIGDRMRRLIPSALVISWLMACNSAGSAKPAPLAGNASTGVAGSLAVTGTTPASAGSVATSPVVPAPATGGAGAPAARSPSAGSGVAAMPLAGRSAADSGDDAGISDAGNTGSPAAGGPAIKNDGPATGPFPPVSDFVSNGPFTPTTLENTGPNSNYTVYLPREAAPAGSKNPIVGWMSGGATVPSLYPLLPHLASHGFVVVASNTAPGIGDEVNLGKEIIAGIDWASSENMRQGSPLFGKLDTTKIAAMGYSMGSLATFTIANDPRLVTTIHISGGNMASERVNSLHAPAAFLCGIPGDANCNILSGDCDIAAANCEIDFANAKTPVFYANFPGGHLGILTAPNQDHIQAEATAWLRWQLMADTTLKTRFVGDQCGVCKDANWQKVQQKNLQ